MTIPAEPIYDRAPSPTPSSSSSTDSSAPLPSFQDLAPPRPFLTVPAEETVLTIPNLEQQVKLKVDAGPGCGGIAWPAGEVLSRYIAYRHSVESTYLKGKRILELGSGTGLVGIVAGLLESTAQICVTDQTQLLDLMRRNVEYNGVGSNVQVEELNWGEAIPVEKNEGIDIVLAADCVYFEPAFPLLVKTLCELAPIDKQIEILFCWKKRRKADKRFFQLLKRRFDSVLVEDDRPGERERYNREGVSLIRLKRRK